jgi:RNA polymerase sigma-70 factor (ECF subfamily)
VTTNQERLEELWREQLPAVLAYCRRRTTSIDDAHDVVAEVYLTAWRLIAKVPAGREARLWLFTVARHALANQTRSGMRRSRLATRIAEEYREGPEVTGEIVDQVREALSRLRETDRELLTLTSWDGLTPAEAAQVLGLTAVTARVRLHRARQRLRIHLGHVGIRADDAESTTRALSIEVT